MATDENNHKNEARDDWTGCTFRVERGPSSEGRASKIKRNNKFLVSVGLLFPPKEALEDDEHPWWYMTAR